MQSYWPWSSILLVFLVTMVSVSSPLAIGANAAHSRVAGAGKTIIEGGTGGATPVPVTTTVAFHADARGGDFECLAFAPPKAVGPGSGQFSVNVMYVTGAVTSFKVTDDSAVLYGTATVTGIGAGQNVPFTALVIAGGPGARIILKVSSPKGELIFHEILLEGHISIQ
jgi:hypothetical protein